MLNTKPNIAGADDFYADLLALHEGKSEKESADINARLILLRANHRAVLHQKNAKPLFDSLFER